MNNKRQATASAKGYILQSYFGIYFFFKDENYKEIDWVKIEGEKEDIEIYYYDKTKDYIQVKTQEKPAKATCFDGKKFKKGILTLYEALEVAEKEGEKVNKLILANNMFFQGIKRLDKKIEKGEEENFIYNLYEDFSDEEISDFSKKVNYTIDQKLYLARIDDSFLLNQSKIIPELKKIINKLALNDIESNIYDALKVLFTENSCDRIKKITKKNVAWTFIKKKINQEKIVNKFNEEFSKELDDSDVTDIEFLLEDVSIIDMIENYSEYYEIYMHFQKLSEDFFISKGKPSKNNIKEFIEYISIPFKEKEYLYIKCSDNYKEQEIKLIYYFFSYYMYLKKNDARKIYDEFDIRG
ncbi:hypothetical protein [Fusobacterium ulcerans]|jgi:hypothetical protein|uniref:hypothetical protein n=1 Tax=Fusobacterium ulcerans TaxID=861 RepID=UPI00103011C9|nr:hypothetical protein [Fusobacterium ulcerans]